MMINLILVRFIMYEVDSVIIACIVIINNIVCQPYLGNQVKEGEYEEYEDFVRVESSIHVVEEEKVRSHFKPERSQQYQKCKQDHYVCPL